MRTLLLAFVFAALRSDAATPAAPRYPPVVTVLLDYDHPYSQVSFVSLQREMQRVLGDAGLKLDVRERQQTAPLEQFSQLLLFHMTGHCTMDALPVGALSDERGALAMAYSADRRILPFGEVRCDRIRESLQRVVGLGKSSNFESVFGSATGLVMAHEVYHMLSHSPHHTRRGLTKEGLSARELLERDLSLSDAARAAIRLNLFQHR